MCGKRTGRLDKLAMHVYALEHERIVNVTQTKHITGAQDCPHPSAQVGANPSRMPTSMCYTA